MAIPVTMTKSLFGNVPDGKYAAVLADVRMIPGDGSPRIRFEFDLYHTDSEINGKKIYGTVWIRFNNNRLEMNPGDELDKWLKALGYDMQLESSFDVEALKNIQCFVTVSNKAAKNGRVFSNVVAVEPYTQQQSQPQAPPVMQPAPAMTAPWPQTTTGAGIGFPPPPVR